jgi:hypothetical protein
MVPHIHSAGKHDDVARQQKENPIMNVKRLSLLFAIVSLAALLLGATPQATGLVAQEPTGCTIPGSWITYLKEPAELPALIMLETLTPLDPWARQLSYVLRLANGDPTFLGLDLEANVMSELVGEAVRTGTNTYDFNVIGYGAKLEPGTRAEIRYIWVVSGSMTCEAGVKTDTADISIYTADQDSDQDGFPDEGQEPVQYIPPHAFSTGRRVP